MTGRERNTHDLFTLLSVLYDRGPKSEEALREELDNSLSVVSDAEVADLVDKAAHLNEWLGLS